MTAALQITVGSRDGSELLRRGLVPILRDLLAEGRVRAQAILAAEGGLACARNLAALTDEVVRRAYLAVTSGEASGPGHDPESLMAVVATGGYGRGTMAPGSDVDLLFLLPASGIAESERIIQAVLYILWDLKLKVGHATRTVEECLREARADMTIRTALLEKRLIVGDRTLSKELASRFDREVVRGSAQAFVEAKLRERDARVRKAGESRYLVEPNVKDGKGGLRDLNTLSWISRYVSGAPEPADMVRADLLTTDEAELFTRCEEFLWRVRCHLHFATGRPEERLSFGNQRLVAERMGYKGRRGQSAIERFMKMYFVTAKQVGDLTALICAALEARHAKRRPVLDRVLHPLRRRSASLDSPDFRIDNDRITTSTADVFEHDPVNLLRLFWLADRHNLPIHPDATHLASRSLRLITPALRRDPKANRLFLEILTSRTAPETVLRRMNETGVLGRFLPDFGRVVSMMQFNMYHHYTVDEHLIRSIGVLAEMESGRLEAAHPLANRIVGTIQHRRTLFVALFLHDIAKGRPEDHSVAGARIARKLGPRLGLDAAETETAAWLVEHHLLMSMTAQSRDLAEQTTIDGFASVVQTIERLKLLLLLTVADIKAVGPGVWTGWKAELLRALYQETELKLTGGESEKFRPDRVFVAQDQLREDLPDWPKEEIDSHFRRLNTAYWLKTDRQTRVKHAHFVRRMAASGESVATMVETSAFRGVSELTIVSPDHPRLLAVVTGACAAAGGNIVDAQIFTSSDGLALDTISLSRAFDLDEDELRRGERIGSAIERALRSQVRIADLVAGRRPMRDTTGTFEITPEVLIDNSLSSRYSVIEVTGLDRPGLLYDLTSAIGRLNLNIASAYIATFGEKAADVFYVADLTGTKISHPSRKAVIRRKLLAVLQGE